MLKLECESMIDIEKSEQYVDFIDITAYKKFNSMFHHIAGGHSVEYPITNPVIDLEVLGRFFNQACSAVWNIKTSQCHIFFWTVDAFNKFTYKECILIRNMKQWKEVFKIVFVPVVSQNLWKHFSINYKPTFVLAPNYQDKIEWEEDKGLYTVGRN